MGNLSSRPLGCPAMYLSNETKTYGSLLVAICYSMSTPSVSVKELRKDWSFIALSCSDKRFTSGLVYKCNTNKENDRTQIQFNKVSLLNSLCKSEIYHTLSPTLQFLSLCGSVKQKVSVKNRFQTSQATKFVNSFCIVTNSSKPTNRHSFGTTFNSQWPPIGHC